ncbi:MAG: VTT domain-containing protein [bacterium]|nr:VTT domain-containing protein [bacterium]
MKDALTNLLLQYPILAPLVFIAIRALAIIFPPIPGIVIDLIGIAVFPWFLGFVYGEIGVIVGAFIAFWIARKFREPLVKKFVRLNKVNQWEEKLSNNQEFWFWVGLRLFFNPLFDYISYAAGLTKISTTRYIITTIIGTVPTMFVIYYFGGISMSRGIYIGGGFIGLLFFAQFIYKRSIKNV